MRVLAQSPLRWTLFETSPGSYVLSVLCGRVLQYGVELRLTEDEARAFEEGGEPSIDVLADGVYADPDRYKGRAISGFAKQDGWKRAIDDWEEAQQLTPGAKTD